MQILNNSQIMLNFKLAYTTNMGLQRTTGGSDPAPKVVMTGPSMLKV